MIYSTQPEKSVSGIDTEFPTLENLPMDSANPFRQGQRFVSKFGRGEETVVGIIHDTRNSENPIKNRY